MALCSFQIPMWVNRCGSKVENLMKINDSSMKFLMKFYMENPMQNSWLNWEEIWGFFPKTFCIKIALDFPIKFS